jgi:Glycerophosphoryl diester phosphodiesterase
LKKKHVGTALGFLAVCVAAKTIYLVAPGRVDNTRKRELEGRNIAHRGLHRADTGIPENSLAAFDAAAENGYGIELDVRLTADDRVVVFHDDDVSRLCGVSGNISEMTWNEIKKLRLLDTNHGIPLLSESLVTVAGRGPVIVELKQGTRNRELCERTLELISCYSGPILIESFDPRIVAWFRKFAPEITRGQLVCPKEKLSGETPLFAAFALANGLTNFLSRPHFIAHSIDKKSPLIRLAEKLGAMRVAWTATDGSHEDENDAVIFEGYRPRTKYR